MGLCPGDFLSFDEQGSDDEEHDIELVRVTDPEEEVFLLYTLRPPPAGRYGLGYLESGTSDLLRLTVALHDAGDQQIVSVEALDRDDEDSVVVTKTPARAKAAKRKGKGAAAQSSAKDVVQILLHQSSTSLRSTAGDTGSVAWRSSLQLGAHLLRALSASTESLLPRSLLLGPSSRILELGSGTAILPSLLLAHPLFRNSAGILQWLSTDQAALVPLMRRNIERNLSHLQSGGISVAAAELDWHDAGPLLRQSAQRQHAWKRGLWAGIGGSTKDDDTAAPHPDLVLGVDCLFNPSLFPALRDTLDLVSLPAQAGSADESATAVLLFCELRSEEIVRSWLAEWLEVKERDRGTGGHYAWCVYSVPKERMGGMEEGNVAWVGWRRWVEGDDL